MIIAAEGCCVIARQFLLPFSVGCRSSERMVSTQYSKISPTAMISEWIHHHLVCSTNTTGNSNFDVRCVPSAFVLCHLGFSLVSPTFSVKHKTQHIFRRFAVNIAWLMKFDAHCVLRSATCLPSRCSKSERRSTLECVKCLKAFMNNRVS